MYQLLTILEFDANFLYLVSHGHLSTQPSVNGTRNVLPAFFLSLQKQSAIKNKWAASSSPNPSLK